MPFPVIIKARNLEDIFFFLFDNVGISICCRGVMATTFLAVLVPKTSLMVLVFLASLILVDGRLVFATKYVSKKSVSRFGFSKIFFLLVCRLVSLETPWIYLPNVKRWLQQRFYLCIDGFLNSFFPQVYFPVLDIQLWPDKRFKAFPEVLDQNLLV